LASEFDFARAGRIACGILDLYDKTLRVSKNPKGLLLYMNNFDFVSPTSLPEALALLSPDARPIAGGTDLLALMKNEVVAPTTLVNLDGLAGFGDIREDDAGLHIGAGARIADVLAWPHIWQTYPLLAYACQYVGWPEIRTMGTIGGNLCQRPRCWYFRHPLGTRCLKRGGDTCYPLTGRADGFFAIFGGGPCYAVHPSDSAPALIAMDATVTIASATQQRTMPLADFFASDDLTRETSLQPNELLLAIDVPKPQPNARTYYRKSKRRPSHDFSGVSVALSVAMQDGVCSDMRLVLGSVALKPWRLFEVEQLLEGKRVDASLVAQASAFAVRDAKPLVSSHGTTNATKLKLTEVWVRRALTTLV
jgi:xanthine dehydrogenase YagS FAD-binding subunit